MTTFDTEAARKAAKPYWWVEIEGLPTRYGHVNSGTDSVYDHFSPGEQNLLQHPLDFDQWTATRCTASADATIAPDKTITAETLAEDGTINSSHFVSSETAVSIDRADYECSCYVKAVNRTWVALQVTDGGTARRCYYDVSNGTVGSSNNTTTDSISDAGLGWWKCSFTYTAANATARCIVFIAEADGDLKFDGQSQSSLHVWRACIDQASIRRQIKTHLATVPTIGGQQADPVNGSCSVPQHQFSLHDKDGDITSLISVSDTPFDRTYLTGPISASDDFVPVEDYSDFDLNGYIYLDRETIYFSSKATNSSNTNTPSATIATGLTATGGGTSWIEDTAFPAIQNSIAYDRYLGCTLTCTGVGTTNTGEVRTVTGFYHDGTTGYYYWKTPMPAACDATTVYSLSSPTNELKCAALNQAHDYWNGAVVEFTAGTNSGLIRWCYDFDATYDMVTLNEHLPEPVDATTRFNIVRYRLTGVTRGACGSTGRQWSFPTFRP